MARIRLTHCSHPLSNSVLSVKLSCCDQLYWLHCQGMQAQHKNPQATYWHREELWRCTATGSDLDLSLQAKVCRILSFCLQTSMTSACSSRHWPTQVFYPGGMASYRKQHRPVPQNSNSISSSSLPSLTCSKAIPTSCLITMCIFLTLHTTEHNG